MAAWKPSPERWWVACGPGRTPRERAHAVLTGEPLDLIETVAERIVDACRDLPGISFMEVVVHKPEAPIAVPFRDVVVRIRREFR